MTSRGTRTRHETAHVELSFSPNVSLVSTVRRFVSEFYVQLLLDGEATAQLALATHELLDNAVQYSADGNTSIRIGMRVEGESVTVVICTQNRASPENIAAARRSLDGLTSAEDPVAHFQRLMRETAGRADGSGLGLARVRTESDMSIGYEVLGDMFQLRAMAKFKVGGTA
jgi:anti-sigma regulatory factor (Ser/Thr protein kinase)